MGAAAPRGEETGPQSCRQGGPQRRRSKPSTVGQPPRRVSRRLQGGVLHRNPGPCPGLLSLGTSDTWSLITLGCGGLSVTLWGVLCVSGLYPLNTTNTFLSHCDIKNAFRHFQMSSMGKPCWLRTPLYQTLQRDREGLRHPPGMGRSLKP